MSPNTAQEVEKGVGALATDGPISYALVRAAKAHKARCAFLLREIGLYPGQEMLLMALRETDHRTQAELVRTLRLDGSTVARMASRLEDQGVVTRRASDSDGRAVIVSLTKRGKQLTNDVVRIWGELEELTVAELSEEEQDSLLDLLGRVEDRLLRAEA